MAIAKNGLTGGVSGKIGNVVGVNRNGSFYFRSMPVETKDPRTEKQVTQRSKFLVTQSFLRTFSPFLRMGFRFEAMGMKSTFNAAMSVNMPHVIKDENNGFVVDYPNVLVSKGLLWTSEITAATVAEGVFCVNWNDVSGDNASYNDEVMMLAYNHEKNVAVYDLHAGKREHLEARLALPINWEGDSVETYIAFMSADFTQVSDSLYAGRHLVEV